jgi:hypothetical protein
MLAIMGAGAAMVPKYLLPRMRMITVALTYNGPGYRKWQRSMAVKTRFKSACISVFDDYLVAGLYDGMVADTGRYVVRTCECVVAPQIFTGLPLSQILRAIDPNAHSTSLQQALIDAVEFHTCEDSMISCRT